jgi:hypothetical protein
MTMKKTFILLAFLFSSYIVGAQNHNMKYHYYQEELQNFWILGEEINHHSFNRILSREGIILPSEGIGVEDESETNEANRLVKEILAPILPRYKSQGLVDFSITYIVLPDGSVDGVYFIFHSFDGKLNITEGDMLLWQNLSDRLKQSLKFTTPPDASVTPFRLMGQGIILSTLLAPESPMPHQSNSATKSKPSIIKVMLKEDCEKFKKEGGVSRPLF